MMGEERKRKVPRPGGRRGKGSGARLGDDPAGSRDAPALEGKGFAGKASPDRCNFPSGVWRAIRAAGLEPSAILHAAGLPASIWLNPATPLSTESYFAIWRAIEALSNDCCFALRIIEAADRTGHQPGFIAGLYAFNFRDAINRLLHLKSMVTSEKLWVTEEKGRWVMGRDWPYATEPEPSLSLDLTFCLMVNLGRRGSGRHIRPVKVQYVRPPTPCDELAEYYGCAIEFEARQNAIIFDSADLDLPFPGYSPEFLDLITKSLHKAYEELKAEGTIREQVKAAMKRVMAGGQLEIAHIASELGMSERTLQRRIAEENATYRELLVEARRELSLHLLADQHLNIDNIASMLGFRTTTSFYRAFKEWKNVSPGKWRAMNAASGQD